MMVDYTLVGMVLFLLTWVAYHVGHARGRGSCIKQHSKAIDAPKPVECWHVWGKWKEKDIHIVDPKGGEGYSISGQHRYCETCGFKESKRIESKR